MNTLPGMIETVAKQHGSRIAIVDGEKAVDYASLERSIASLAAELYDRGVQPGDRVALLLPNGLDFVTGYLAIVGAGAIAVLLNHQYQQKELTGLLEQCRVSMLVTSKDFAPLCDQVLPICEPPCTPFFMEDRTEPSGLTAASLSDLKASMGPDSPVMYQFSSGSTGKPKQIGRTHANLLFELDSLLQMLQISHEDRFLGVVPFSHVNGLMRTMLASIRAGATLYPLLRFDRQGVAEAIEKNKISLFIAVPFMFSMLAKTNFRRRPNFSSLRLCISASAAMPGKLNQQFYQAFGRYVRQLYGSTETGTISVNLRPDVENSLESVGSPIAGVEVQVFTEDGRIAKPGEIGELAVKSPATIRAYEGLDEANQKAFRDGFFFTGDLGKRDEEGLLYLVGRKKFFINKGGYKIDPREIEEVIESHAAVEEVVVLGLPTPYGDERVKAVVVLKTSVTEEEIINHCRGKIASFKVPSLVEFRESLPKSPTGKILREMLK